MKLELIAVFFVLILIAVSVFLGVKAAFYFNNPKCLIVRCVEVIK